MKIEEDKIKIKEGENALDLFDNENRLPFTMVYEPYHKENLTLQMLKHNFSVHYFEFVWNKVKAKT